MSFTVRLPDGTEISSWPRLSVALRELHEAHDPETNPLTQPEANRRTSGRQRMRPLEWWSNERAPREWRSNRRRPPPPASHAHAADGFCAAPAYVRQASCTMGARLLAPSSTTKTLSSPKIWTDG